jgi:hypothetical protein
MITCFEKKRLFVLFTLFAFTLLFASCDNEDEKDTSIYQERESFENYLTEKINGYVEEKTSELVDEQTSIWTLQPIRMLKHSFFVNDSTRKGDWYQAVMSVGLSTDSINSFINREIDTYNTFHKGNEIEYMELNSLEQEEIIDDNAFSLIKELEYYGAYDLIDILIGSFIAYIVGWVFGFIVAYVFFSIFTSVEDENNTICRGIGYLFMIIWACLFLWLTYKYVVLSMELENVISSNIINTLF